MTRWIGLLSLIPLSAVALAQPAPSAPPSSTASPAMSASQVRAALGTAVEANDAAGAEASAKLLAEMGAGLSDASQEKIAPLLSPERAADLQQLFADNLTPVTASEPYGSVSVEHSLVEGLAYDPVTKRLFAGTVVGGKLLVANGMDWRVIALPKGKGGLFGMVVDAKARRLWIANGPADPVADKGAIMPGLFAVDADTLAVVDHKAMPAGSDGSPGDVALAEDGTVYVSDGLKGAIYRCKPGCATLEQFVAPGTFKSPQGMALSRDGTELIVAILPPGSAACSSPMGRSSG